MRKILTLSLSLPLIVKYFWNVIFTFLLLKAMGLWNANLEVLRAVVLFLSFSNFRNKILRIQSLRKQWETWSLPSFSLHCILCKQFPYCEGCKCSEERYIHWVWSGRTVSGCAEAGKIGRGQTVEGPIGCMKIFLKAGSPWIAYKQSELMWFVW